LRKAIDGVLASPEELKVNRQPKTDAVDPELTDAMKARMGARSRRSRN
jgi:hypothetical protein